MKRLWIEVRNPSGEVLGIVNLIDASLSQRLDQIGEIKVTVAATDPNASDLMQINRRVALYEWRNDTEGKTFLGQGILLKKNMSLSAGQIQVAWTGMDALEELRRVYTGRGRVYLDDLFIDTIRDLMSEAGSWRLLIDDSQTNVSKRFDGVSIYKAITDITKGKGIHVRLGGENTLEVKPFGADSGLTITGIRHSMNQLISSSHVALIDRLELVEDGTDIVNWIEPIAGSAGDASLTLKRCTRTAPYPIQSETGPDGRLRYFISDADSIADYGRVQRVISLPSLVPVEPSSTAVINAANMLYDFAAAYLDRRKVPQKTYRAAIKKLDKRIKVGDKVRLRYKGEVTQGSRVVDYVDIDADFWILSLDERWAQQGMGATLELSNIDIPTIEAAQILADGASELKDGQVGLSLKISAYKPKADIITISPGNPQAVILQLSSQTVEVTKALVMVSREGPWGPDTITITVDGQTVTGSPFLGGSGSDSFTIDIEDLITNGTVDIQAAHEIEFDCLYHSGALTVQLDVMEVIAAVT